MTSTQKIHLGNFIAALITLFVCFVIAGDPVKLFLTLVDIFGAAVNSTFVKGTLAYLWLSCAIASTFVIARQFVFNNPLIRFFYQIPVPCQS